MNKPDEIRMENYNGQKLVVIRHGRRYVMLSHPIDNACSITNEGESDGIVSYGVSFNDFSLDCVLTMPEVN